MTEDPVAGRVSRCSSCGLVATPRPELPDPPFPASAECWHHHGRLTAYNMERARIDFPHQTAVDAYAAQHPGPPARPITFWFALVGLHLALDRGKTGRQVQQAHTLLARRRRDWPAPPSPDRRAVLTVADVVARPYGEARDAAIREWAADVWACWTDLHATVAELTDTIDSRP